jgi:molecular chaperone DnaJ
MRPRRPVDPHAVLGVDPGASRAEVRRAYRMRAMAIHPDTSPDPAGATEAMAELNRARDELLARSPRHAGTGTVPDDDPGVRPKPRRRPERPAAAEGHEAAWADHWSAWNELPRRDRR